MAQTEIRLLKPADHRDQTADHEEAVLELQRLLACYQLASMDDKRVVWAALNKYAKHITL